MVFRLCFTPVLAAAVAMFAACSVGVENTETGVAAIVQEGRGPKVRATIDAKLVEVSGLGQRKHDGKLEIIAVGDRRRRIATADASVTPLTFTAYDAPGDPSAVSQWEAVAGDASGRVFTLEEGKGIVHVFDPELTKEDARIELAIEKNVKKKDWADENSRGEGMVLLKNGHILLLKEKDPSELVEFGPSDDTARGYDPGQAVTANDTFPLPAEGRRDFVVLKEWAVGDASSGFARDTSELAVGPDGLLYVLSDKGTGHESTISVMERKLGPREDAFRFRTTWKLPKTIEKAEGLTILPDGRTFVASDQQKVGNVYAISNLE